MLFCVNEGVALEEIRFLEILGGHPVSVRQSIRAYEDRVAALDIDAVKRKALLDKDVGALSSLLGGRVRMAMNVTAPDGGEESEELPERRDDEQQTDTEPPEADPPN